MYALAYYSLIIVDNVKGLALFSIVVLGILGLLFGSIVAAILDSGFWEEYKEHVFKMLKYYVSVLAITVSMITVLPSKKDSLILLGLYFGEDLIAETAKEGSKLPPKLLKLINTEIDEALNLKEGE